jgi:hypothetical protein
MVAAVVHLPRMAQVIARPSSRGDKDIAVMCGRYTLRTLAAPCRAPRSASPTCPSRSSRSNIAPTQQVVTVRAILGSLCKVVGAQLCLFAEARLPAGAE